MKFATWFVLSFLIPITGICEDNGFESLDRLIAEARATKEWKTAKTAAEKLNLIRDAALKKDTASDPVSDRYLITALGGPIDIVHLLGLAIPVCKGTSQRDAALLSQWKAEGGPDFEAGRSGSFPTEAHPDDLPSNALGALFGEEIRAKSSEPGFDVVTALKNFLFPLEPVPDKIAKKFSHRVIVMGLAEDASRKTIRSRYEWFTAEPLFSLYAFDAKRAKELGTAAGALAKAGFRIREIEGRPIAIDRISKTQ